MFAGERFLQVELPDYEREWFTTTCWLVGATVFWLFVAPLFLMQTEEPAPETKETSGAKKKRSKSAPTTASSPADTSSNLPTVRYIPLWANVFACACLFASVVYILMTKSPNNYYSPRRVFQAPLLTLSECQTIIQMADTAAQHNYETALQEVQQQHTDDDPNNNTTREALLREPLGWQKTRHGSYPTTDLNLVTDPFSSDDRRFLSNLLDRRLAPLIARVYGIPERSIRANDMFVVRYDAPNENDAAADNSGKRAHLANHTDSEDVSFNILLNNNFEGTLLRKL